MSASISSSVMANAGRSRRVAPGIRRHEGVDQLAQGQRVVAFCP
jgi:hypothetical protein